MGKAKHTRDSELEFAVKELGIPREDAEALYDAVRQVAKAAPDLSTLKVSVHNMFVVASREPYVKEAQNAARKAAAPDVQVGQRVLGLKGVRPRYLETIQGEVDSIIGDDVTIRLDTYYLNEPGDPQDADTVNWSIDHRVSKYVRGGKLKVKVTMVVTAENAPDYLKDGKPEKAAA